jgi:hypothetical protein
MFTVYTYVTYPFVKFELQYNTEALVNKNIVVTLFMSFADVAER